MEEVSNFYFDLIFFFISMLSVMSHGTSRQTLIGIDWLLPSLLWGMFITMFLGVVTRDIFELHLILLFCYDVVFTKMPYWMLP